MDFIKLFMSGKLVRVFLFVVSLTTTFPVYANDRANDRICPAQLQQEITKIAQSPKLQAARVGVFVQTNDPNPQVLANLDGDRYFIPASNVKLFTTAIALKNLGANHQFHTQLLAERQTPQGEINNGLWLFGAGDPSFSSATGLKSLVTQLKNKGIKRINGGIGATTIRKGTGLVGSWEWQDLQEYYAAIASPFTINENSLNWTVRPSKVGDRAIFEWETPALASDWLVENTAITVTDDAALYNLPDHELKIVRPYGQKKLIISGRISEKAEPEDGGIAVPDPEANFVDLLRRELISQGIEIAIAPQKPKYLTQLANVNSPPISQLVVTTNKDSNNLYAELLLRALGEEFYGNLLTKPLGINFHQLVALNDENGGLSAINAYLKSVNIAADDVLLADGSGLSRHNLAKPRAIAQFLQVVDRDRDIAPYFRKSLPIAGVDGSLRNRFKDTDAQGLIQAKTGTLTGVIALSGYANPKNYREVIFSIMINNGNLPTKELQQYVDAIALTLINLDRCQ
jgi:D-alanyl-D-alanine carboxypeptidase/D-alanyl-D-alanine-endopeptidase (penicillin-binding protein 4)